MKLIDILIRELPKRGGWPIESNGCRQFPDGEVCFSNVGKKPDFYTECATDVDLVWRKTVTPHASREQYEAALAAKDEGWIEWGGGECPVADFLKVEYQLRGGAKGSEYAKILEWRHEGGRHGIIAYRLRKPQGAAQAEANDESSLNECIGKDAAPVWNGEDLPPVGCFCEITDPNGMLVYGQGESGEVIAHVENTAVIRMSYGLGCFEAGFLRPLRTEVERKREEAVRVIYEILEAGTSTKQDAADIYNAIESGEIPGVKLED